MSNLSDRLREGRDRAAFEAEKLRRIYAEQNALSQLRADRKGKIGELGEATLAVYRQNQVTQPELLRPCQDLVALELQIQQREGTLEAIRAEQFIPAPVASLTCPHCHRPVQPDAPFCAFCGTALARPAPAAGSLVCPACGAGVPAIATFCPACGHRMAAAAPPPACCANCSAPLPPAGAFCPECGTPVPQPGAAPAVARPAAPLFPSSAGFRAAPPGPHAVEDAATEAPVIEAPALDTPAFSGPAAAAYATDVTPAAASLPDDWAIPPSPGEVPAFPAPETALAGAPVAALPQAPAAEPAPAAEVRCPNCSTSLSAVAIFCPECGTRLK